MRLTSKYGYIDENKKPVIGRGYISQFNVAECINKLGPLEDIEDELGIDLITLFKAVKNGVWFRIKMFNLTCTLFADEVCWICDENTLHLYCTEHNFDLEVDLSKYGKDWALTKEELENENTRT